MKERQLITRIVRPLRGGQITIPAEFRRQLGIGEDSVLQLSLQGKELRIRPLRLKQTADGSPWFSQLYDRFAPVRQEAARLSKEEVDVAIDEAVRATRRGHA